MCAFDQVGDFDLQCRSKCPHCVQSGVSRSRPVPAVSIPRIIARSFDVLNLISADSARSSWVISFG